MTMGDPESRAGTNRFVLGQAGRRGAVHQRKKANCLFPYFLKSNPPIEEARRGFDTIQIVVLPMPRAFARERLTRETSGKSDPKRASKAV